MRNNNLQRNFALVTSWINSWLGEVNIFSNIYNIYNENNTLSGCQQKIAIM